MCLCVCVCVCVCVCCVRTVETGVGRFELGNGHILRSVRPLVLILEVHINQRVSLSLRFVVAFLLTKCIKLSLMITSV